MGNTALWTVIVAALAVIVNAGVSIFVHFRRVKFEEAVATKKFEFDVSLAERKATLDHLSANHRHKQELALDILSAYYEVHHSMPAVRSMGSWGTEGESRPRLDEEAAETEKLRNTYFIVIERLDKRRDLIVRFMRQQFTAMALLGPDAAAPFEDFNQLLNRISVSAKMLIMTVGNIEPSKTIEWKADIWEGYGDVDKVKVELNKILDAIESLCKPILTAKSPVLSDVPHR